jgi:apolipoprotein N-acyltransferase
LRRAATEFVPTCIAKLSKFSCFGAHYVWPKFRAPPGHIPTFWSSSVYFIISFFLVGFGQPAWIPEAGLLAAAGGYALFWKAMLQYPKRLSRFYLSLAWFVAVHAIQLSWMTSTQYMGPMILGVYAFLLIGLGVQFGLFSILLSGQLVQSQPFRTKPNEISDRGGKKLAARYRSGKSLSGMKELFNPEKKISQFQCFALAGGFVLLEWIRLYFLTGFTWNPAGLALGGSRYAIQLAALFGIYGMTFWVIWTNLSALAFLLRPTAKRAATWAVLALFPYGFGFFNESWVKSSFRPEKHVAAALVDTALRVEEKSRDTASPRSFIPPLAQWERVWDYLNTDRPIDLIVLPEAAFPYGTNQPFCPLEIFQERWKLHFGDELLESDFPPMEAPYAFLYHWQNQSYWIATNAFFAQTLANHFNADLIVGFDYDDGATRRTNAAFLFRPHKQPERYDKRILAPIGEYITLQNIQWIADFLYRQFGIRESFDVGNEAKIFDSHTPIGVPICLEEMYSGLVRDLRKRGAELLVSLSNDVWFPSSRLARQHYEHGRIRAVENGVYLLRSSNMGMTGAVDCFGEPIGIQTPGKKGAIYLSIPVFSYPTLFAFWGDAAILCISSLSFLIFLLFKAVSKKTKKKLPLNGQLG